MDNADVGIERIGGRQGRPGGHVPEGAVREAFHPYCLELLIAHHIESIRANLVAGVVSFRCETL